MSNFNKIAFLENQSFHNIRFSEVDSMGILWHGHYLQSLEEAREIFWKKYNLGYFEIYAKGFKVPIVDLQIKYKKFVKYGDEIMVKIKFLPDPSAKIIFEYQLFRKSDGMLCSSAKTIQVFLNLKDELQLISPPFFHEWKVKNFLN